MKADETRFNHEGHQGLKGNHKGFLCGSLGLLKDSFVSFESLVVKSLTLPLHASIPASQRYLNTTGSSDRQAVCWYQVSAVPASFPIQVT